MPFQGSLNSGVGQHESRSSAHSFSGAGATVKIDINSLTEAELVALNHRIVERLRFLHQARAHARMLEFRIGDRVSFEPEGRGVVADPA